MKNKIIKDIFFYAKSENANYLAISSDDEKIIFNLFLPLNNQKTLSLPKRYGNSFYSDFSQTFSLSDNEFVIKKEHSLKINDKLNINFRLSLIPAESKQEKIIIEFIKNKAQIMRLSQLGLKRSDLFSLKKSLEKNTGIIIFAGKSGSGKSTTLLSCLNYLNTENKNIGIIGQNIEHVPSGVLPISTKLDSLNYINNYKLDILAIDSINSHLLLGEAFKVASQGRLVICTVNCNSKEELSNIINKAPWPKNEKLKNLIFVSNQKLKKLPDNINLKSVFSDNRKNKKRDKIARFNLLYFNN